MLERPQIMIAIGEGRRHLTDEEWELFQKRIANGDIQFSSYMDDMEKLFENMDFMSILKYDEIEQPIKEDNHLWKKSNKHKHPAFKRK